MCPVTRVLNVFECVLGKCMGFGLALAKPSQNKLIWFKACVVVCCGVETK